MIGSRYALAAALLALPALLPASLMATAAYADSAAGERLARQWCANCHVIDVGNPGATVPQGPPTFRMVAQQRSSDELRTFLTRPHPPMPDLALTRAEIDDLIAYIETLK